MSPPKCWTLHHFLVGHDRPSAIPGLCRQVRDMIDTVPNDLGEGIHSWTAADLRNGVTVHLRRGELPGILEALS